MDLNLIGKTVVVTGGASNIGRGISLAFAAEGAQVYVADIDADQIERVLVEAPEQLHGVRCDITDWNAVQNAVQAVKSERGGIDVLVNNAGWTNDLLFIEKPREEWEREVNLNMWGFINMTRAVLDGMIERNAGRIVTISSDAGRIGEFREAVYSGTKAAVIAMSKAIAKEVGKYGITLNCVCPGAVPAAAGTVGDRSMWQGGLAEIFQSDDPARTAKILKAYPLRRLGTPADIASAVLFLASDAAAYITGQTLGVDGGYAMP